MSLVALLLLLFTLNIGGVFTPSPHRAQPNLTVGGGGR